MMNDVELFSSLVSDIYDAALDSARWPNTLQRLCDHAGATASMIFSQDSTLKVAQRYYSWGDDPRYTKLYFEKYVALSPFLTLPHFTKVEEVRSVRELVPWREIQDTRFYREWMLPQGYVDNVFATLEKSQTSYAAFAVTRSQISRPTQMEVRRRLQLFIPHIRRAVSIGKTIDLYKVDAASLLAAMDSLSVAIVLVDSSGKIVKANAAGRSMLNDGHVVTSERGTLYPHDPKARVALREATAATLRGDEQIGTQGIALILKAKNGDHYLADVLPLTSGARQTAGIKYSATAAVFVRKAGLNIPSPPEILIELYKLTPSELRVLHAIVEIGGVPAVAEALGISEATTKVHLHRIFQKTGARRQADLVKIVAGASSPLAR